MASGSELSRIDRTILRYCDSRSPQEISDMLGNTVTPERVMAIKEELLTSRKWVTMAQEEELVLFRLREIVSKFEDIDTMADMESARVHLAYLKEIGARLDKRRAATQVDLETYDLNVAREMTRAYEIALSYLKGALRDEIDEERWDEVTKEALAHAGREVAKKAVEA
jgi:hypothetical protein